MNHLTKGKTMKRLTALFVLVAMALPAHAIEFRTQDNVNAGQASRVKCAKNAKCSVAGSVGQIELNPRVTASTTALTKAQCGSTVVSAAAVTQPLPALADVDTGCRYTFIVGVPLALNVNPSGTERILLLSDANGDSIEADATGESVTLEKLSTSEWTPVGAVQGTWSDAN